MADSNLPFEERESLITIIANTIGYELFGPIGIPVGKKQVCLDLARACLDTVEHAYKLEELDE